MGRLFLLVNSQHLRVEANDSEDSFKLRLTFVLYNGNVYACFLFRRGIWLLSFSRDEIYLFFILLIFVLSTERRSLRIWDYRLLLFHFAISCRSIVNTSRKFICKFLYIVRWLTVINNYRVLACGDR